MARFDDAQVGDKVYSRLWGFGVIEQLDIDKSRPVKVRYYDGEYDNYRLDGRVSTDEIEPTLFYVDGDNKYSEVRPSPKLDWAKVPVDTRVIFKDIDSYEGTNAYYSGVGECFSLGRTSWTDDGETNKWNIILLAEPVTIDGITWPIGTTWRREK